ncbi:hypothetical protein ANCDUO_14458 [Ancylostoma duodenale]|uniref:Large ribosomal subunit protein uL11 C-terminal domain-containing protein n=1 Tax=Ancylostoma duodenale TaxID=51022 RepID=A0A0C2G3E6_9BILA|nr:hypothetical protein ANCDUO_14458 [Ancylostoma duodenale]
MRRSGDLALDSIIKIARIMRPRSMARKLERTVKEILRTARSVGCSIDGQHPHDIAEQITSDIFVIIDSETDGKLESTKILERISSARARLFFIMVETYTNFDDTTYQLVNQLAAKSGGAALRATDYVSVQKFFEQYFSIILDGDLVSYQEFFPQEQNLETQSFYWRKFSCNLKMDHLYAQAQKLLSTRTYCYGLAIRGAIQAITP